MGWGDFVGWLKYILGLSNNVAALNVQWDHFWGRLAPELNGVTQGELGQAILSDITSREAASPGWLVSNPSGELQFSFSNNGSPITLEYRYQFFNPGPSGTPTIVVGTVFTP